MSRDDITRMAQEAGMKIDYGNFADDMYVSVLYRFANLVAAAEREACAKVCKEFGKEWCCEDTTNEIIAEIRARGEGEK